MLTQLQRDGRRATIDALRAIHGTKDRAPADARRYWDAIESELAADTAKRQAREQRRREKREAAGGTWYDGDR